MRISELAEKSGIDRNTIHYYFREGLLPPPLKTGRTMAFYSNAHLECLGFIRKMREEQNLPITAIRLEVQRIFGKYWKPTARERGTRQFNHETQIKGERQRQRIIDTAVILFSSEGYHSTHVSHITDALGLSKGTFYLYFKDKNDLLVAVFAHLMEELAKTVIEDEDDIFVRMVKRGESYVEFYKKYHQIFNIIRAESIGSKMGPQLSVRAIYQKIMEPLVRDIKAGREKGLFPKTSIDPELVSYMIMGALDFLCYRLLLDDKKSTSEIVKTIRHSRLFKNLLFGNGEER